MPMRNKYTSVPLPTAASPCGYGSSWKANSNSAPATAQVASGSLNGLTSTPTIVNAAIDQIAMCAESIKPFTISLFLLSVARSALTGPRPAV